MAQIVQPNINAIGGGSTPTQVGAVVFDKPQYDPLTIQMKVMGDLDDWADKKRAEQAAVKQEIDKIADFSIKDILDKDTDYFLQGKNKLIDAQAELGKYKYGSPEYKLALENAKRDRAKYELDVEASVMHRKRIEDMAKEYDPAKHDAKKYLDWNKRMIEAPTLEERIKISTEQPLAPKIGNFQQILSERMKNGIYKPQEIDEEIRTKQGRVGVRKTIQYTDDNIKDYAQAIINGDADMTESAQNEFQKLQNSHSILYDQIVGEAEQLGIDPLELYVRKQLKNSVTKQIGLSNLAFDPKETAKFTFGLGEEKEEQGVRFIVEQVGNLLNGAERSYTVGGEKLTQTFDVPGGQIQIEGQAPMISDQFQGHPMGVYMVEKPKLDAVGNVITDAQGKPIVEKESKPNIVISWKWMNGKPYIKTEETVYNAGKKVGGVPVDLDGWKLANQTDGERLLMNQVTPSQRLQAQEKYRKLLQQTGGYEGFAARPEELTKGAQERVKQEPTKVTVNPKQKTLNKVDYSQYPQSSDGKWYYDGKEWKAIEK